VLGKSGRQIFRTVLSHPVEVVLCCILITLVIVIFSQVISRYVLHVSLSWSEEVARFLLIWLAMLSAAYGFKARTHFALTIVVNRFNPKLARVVGVLVTAAMCGLMGVFIYYAYFVTQNAMGRVSPATQVSMAVPYSATVVGGVLMFYYILRSGWQNFRDNGRDRSQSMGGEEV